MNCLAGFLVVSIPMLFIAMLIPGAFGGGDIKLMAVSGIFLGYKANVMAAIYALFLAAIHIVFMFFCLLRNREKMPREIPFGPYLCLGIFMAYLLQ